MTEHPERDCFVEVKLSSETYQAGADAIRQYVGTTLLSGAQLKWARATPRIENLSYEVEWIPEWGCYTALGKVDVIYSLSS